VLVAWPILFGLILTLLRLVVLATFGADPVRAADVGGLALSLAGQVTTALFLALPLHFLRESRWRWAVYPFVVAIVFLNVAAFHYEAVFGRLPGVSLLYYLGEATHLASSAGQHAPLCVVIAEVLLASALLILAAEKRRQRRLNRAWAIVCLLCAILTVVVYVRPRTIPRELMWRARTPILWALQSWTVQRSYETGPLRLDREQVIEFQRRIGIRNPFAGADDRYPLCDPSPRPQTAANGRSVIFLILESVAIEEVAHMPNLQRIAKESVVFRDAKAGGTKSLQAMPALFAGIPPQPAAHMLWRRPLNNLEGFPLILRGHGYKTAYFHGGDLSFEQQRPFLKMIGFEEIVELDPAEPIPVYGWGHSDDVVFRKMERWIDAHRGAPYLATLFTLSTHDPYVIPGGGQRKNLREAFLASLQFLDEQLRQFYDWYLKHEAPRGTILVITGDHAPHLAGEEHIEDHEVTRFDVPLLIRGLRPGFSTRPAAHHDLPATILGLTGLPPGPCNQGLNLFGRDVPEDRVRYAVSGDQLEEFHVWLPDARVHLDRVRGEAQATPKQGGREAAAEAARNAGRFYELARSVSAYLVNADAFAPPPSTVRLTRKSLSRVARPLFVAHRGQSRGPLPPERQNTRETIEQALKDGFAWVEIDVNLTRDGELAVVHDDVSSKTLAELPGVMTLRQAIDAFADRAGLLIELKPQNALGPDSLLAMRAAMLVRPRGKSGRIIMDSFSPFIASSLDRHCDCPVGLDAPNRELDSRWVDSVALEGLDWIYVDHRQASAELIRYAHGRGLRVAVFTVNDLREIEKLRGEWPDAVITDRADVAAKFR
jgi:glycerophosphoryl diester phosphodiesterase/membrane-anchored protein YejM (alkaline phosphatase superfamily)